MKKRDTGLLRSLGRRRERLRRHDRAVLDGRAVDDDPLPAFRPYSTTQRLPTRAPSLTFRIATLLPLRRATLHLEAILELGDRALRHEQRVGPDRGLRR